MNYYRASIARQCEDAYCKKKVTHEIRQDLIEKGERIAVVYGSYCKHHVERKLLALRRAEATA